MSKHILYIIFGSGATRPLILVDLPFGTCEGSPFEALSNAQRLLKVILWPSSQCSFIIRRRLWCRKAVQIASKSKEVRNEQRRVRNIKMSPEMIVLRYILRSQNNCRCGNCGCGTCWTSSAAHQCHGWVPSTRANS